MKKNFTTAILIFCCFYTYAQKISLVSNGYSSTFTRVDTLFFNEYAGQRTKLQLPVADSLLNNSILQFDSSFGVVTHSITETNAVDEKFFNSQKLLTTTFYAYIDGTLQAPTSTLFFQPKNQSSVNEIFKQFGTVVTHPDFKGFFYLHLNTVIYNTGDKIINLCDSLYQQGLALIIEPVFIRLNVFFDDPLYPNQWNIANTGQYGGTVGADMHVADTWCLGYGGLGIKIAVIDEGVDLNHPDIQAKLLAGYDATGNNSAGACAAGDTHGTSCAGIIAEGNNNIGGQGVAYKSKIIPIRVGTGGTINDSWAASGINWAVNHHADILSNSWGGGSPSSQIDQAIQNAVQNGRNGKGSLVVFAAGNDNDLVSYPATNSNTIAVGASCECDTRKRSSNDPNQVNPGVETDPLGTSCDGEFWWGSNFGTDLDVMAPGVWITTTTNGAAYINNFNGTSAACPNTAAVLALILSVNTNLTGQDARNMLESTCEKVGNYIYNPNVSGQPNGTWSTDAGYGRVDAFDAVAKAIATLVSISGSPNFCTGSSSYTINTPVNTTVNWSVNPSGIVSLSPNGNTATLTKIANGAVTLTGTIYPSCRTGVLITKKIVIGPAIIDNNASTFNNDYNHQTNNLHATNFISAPNSQVVHINVFPSSINSTATSYTWTRTSGTAPWTQSQGVLTFTLGGTGTGYGTSASFTVTMTSPCGNSTFSPSFALTGGFFAANNNLFSIRPNPAQNYVTISADNSKDNYVNHIYGIKIMNHFGELSKAFEFKNGIKTAKIRLDGLNSGDYLILIFDGHRWISKQLIIQK